MPRITRDLAARLSATLAPADAWHDARAALDAATGGTLGPVQLDMLTVWAIEARVAASSLAPERRGRFRFLVRVGATVAELAAVFGTLAPDEAAA